VKKYNANEAKNICGYFSAACAISLLKLTLNEFSYENMQHAITQLNKKINDQ